MSVGDVGCSVNGGCQDVGAPPLHSVTPVGFVVGRSRRGSEMEMTTRRSTSTGLAHCPDCGGDGVLRASSDSKMPKQAMKKNR